MIMNFSTASNISLSDSLSGYVTCDEDSENTRYLSLLSQDASFEGLNVTLCNSEVDNDETQLVELTSEDDIDQPFIFTIDGSNEIYGVQSARDEDGNLQKYQIQYMKDINGELTPMIETIQLLPSESDIHSEIADNNLITSDNMCDDEEQSAIDSQLVVGKEVNSVFQENDDINNHGGEYAQNHNEADNPIFKPEIVCNSSLGLPNLDVKQESPDIFKENDSYVSEEMKMSVRNLKIEANIPTALVQIEMNENTTEPAVHFGMDKCIENDEQSQVLQSEEQMHVVEHFEQLFVQENHVVEDSQNVDMKDIIDNNDSDNETYHIVDGIHVTGDVESENSFIQSTESVLKEAVEHHPKTNILKKSSVKFISKDQTCLDQKVIYVQTLPEKENMDIFEVGSLAKPNSRSLLKCNQPQGMVIPDPLHVELAGEVTRTNTKRYTRTKEARQARQFINFLNSTTIPHVPERKERLPRKQQIKLVKHANEDIIVKEMIVSSNEFIEPFSAGEKKYLPVTDYVEVLDSGDECSTVERKKKINKGKVETVEISDSEDSEVDVMESDIMLNGSDEDNNDGISKTKITKKKRGRPPKSKHLDNDKKDSDSNSESPPKISRTESDVESVTSCLEVIRVENDTNRLNTDNSSTRNPNSQDSAIEGANCNTISSTEVDELTSSNVTDSTNDKIPSITVITSSENAEATGKKEHIQNTQKTELQKLNLENDELGTISNSQQSEDIQKKRFDYKHECEKCKTKFINKFLLNRHNCIVKSGLPFSCDNCKKKFPNSSTLNVHKKIHVKAPQMAKSNSLTKIPQVSTSKQHEGLSSKSTSNVPSVKKAAGVSVRNPVRESIIPVRSTFRARAAKCLSAPLVVPSKLGKDAIVAVSPVKTSKANNFKCEKQCDKCSEKCFNYAAWFDHQVLKHGLQTPDKKIREKKPQKLVKTAVAHNGIQAGPALAKNFSLLQSKMRHLQ